MILSVFTNTPAWDALEVKLETHINVSELTIVDYPEHLSRVLAKESFPLKRSLNSFFASIRTVASAPIDKLKCFYCHQIVILAKNLQFKKVGMVIERLQ